MAIRITDTTGDGGTITTEKITITEALREWYPAAPAEVASAIADLQTSVMADHWEQAHALAEFLGLTVELVP